MLAIFRKELLSYFDTKIAWIFTVIFVLLANFITFAPNHTLEANIASLDMFFELVPWLYCLLLPALSMSLFADEIKKGSLEVLFSLPISTRDIVLGKFSAAWAFTGICLVLTMNMWVSLNILGEPDNLLIASSYLAAFLLAGSLLAVGINLSVLTKSQTIAFILNALIIIALLFLGSVKQLDFLSLFDFLPAYMTMISGLIKISDLVFFFTLGALGLISAAVLLEGKKL